MPSETQVKKEITDALNRLGVEHWRIQCGRWKVRGGWMHGAANGTADILASVSFHNSHDHFFLWIEVKKPGGEQSKEQREFESTRAAKRHLYLLVESVDQLLEWFRNSGARG